MKLNVHSGLLNSRGVSAFLLAHMPLAMDLLNFQGATAASSTAMLGVRVLESHCTQKRTHIEPLA